MQELNRLKICTNFILKNSDRGKYLSDRFSEDSRRINNNQIFISLEPDMKKNIKNIKTNIFCPLAVNTKLRDVIMPGEDKSKISDPKEVAAKIVNYILEEAGTGEIIEIT